MKLVGYTTSDGTVICTDHPGAGNVSGPVHDIDYCSSPSSCDICSREIDHAVDEE